jgi:hypothetical protein
MSRRLSKRKRAADLLAMIEHGPAFHAGPVPGGKPLTPDQAAKVYRLWFESFVVDELAELLRVKPAEPGATS